MTAATEQQIVEQSSGWFPLRRIILLAFVGAALVSGIYGARMMFGIGTGSPAATDVESLTYRVGSFVNVPVDGRIERLQVIKVESSEITVEDSETDRWMCDGAVTATNCQPVFAPVPGPVTAIGYPNRSEALENCLAPRRVEPLYRAGNIAGWSCVRSY